MLWIARGSERGREHVFGGTEGLAPRRPAQRHGAGVRRGPGFIAQDNGAELDFRASDLTATPPRGAKASRGKLKDGKEATRPVAYVMPSPP
jgi:hypothetical protein